MAKMRLKLGKMRPKMAKVRPKDGQDEAQDGQDEAQDGQEPCGKVSERRRCNKKSIFWAKLTCTYECISVFFPVFLQGASLQSAGPSKAPWCIPPFGPLECASSGGEVWRGQDLSRGGRRYRYGVRTGSNTPAPWRVRRIRTRRAFRRAAKVEVIKERTF